MKSLLIALTLISSLSATANSFGTADNMNYVIIVNDGHNVISCASQVKAISREDGIDGQVKTFKLLGTLHANLSSIEAQKVADLKCVMAIEVEILVEGNPRIGRNN